MAFVYLGVKEIKVMAREMNALERASLKAFNEQLENSFGLKAVATSGKDYMGFTWFEVFKHGKSTGNQYNAIDEKHAIAMYNQIIMP